jgi:two-component system, cell cycle response regulator
MFSEPQLDELTGLMTRPALLATLFRETDRIQRSRQPLSLVLLALDNFSLAKSRLAGLGCDAVLLTVVERIGRLLRSYDTFGRTGDYEFLLILPGCSALNANLLAERLRAEIFTEPVSARCDAVRLTASFGIASSDGRSPIVVMQEAESALRSAQESGAESIHTFKYSSNVATEPIEFLS